MSDDFKIESIVGESVLTKYTGEDADIVILHGVTKIGSAFFDCPNLIKI